MLCSILCQSRVSDSEQWPGYRLDERGIILRVSAGARPALGPIKAVMGRLRLKCDGTRAEITFLLSAKRTSPFKSAGDVSSVDYWQPRCAASAVVMLDTPCSEVVWRVLATHCIRQFPLHFPSRASPCAVTFQLESTGLKRPGLEDDRPPSVSAKVKHEWNCTSTTPYGLVTFAGTTLSHSHFAFWSRQ